MTGCRCAPRFEFRARRLCRRRHQASSSAVCSSSQRDDVVSKKDKRRAAAEARAAVADLRKEARQAETKLEKLNRQKATLEARQKRAGQQGPPKHQKMHSWAPTGDA